VHGVAKTLADCLKHRNEIGLDVAIGALKDALSQKKASAEKLWRFAKICRVANGCGVRSCNETQLCLAHVRRRALKRIS